MHKRTIYNKRTDFPFLIKENIKVIIFPQTQWTVRMN